MDRATKRRVYVLSPRRADLVLYGDMLERDGFTVEKLSNLADADSELAAAQHGFVLLAIEGWVESATALVQAFRTKGSDIRFLGFAASAETARQAVAAGCLDCLQIPLPVDSVVETVNRLIDCGSHHGSVSPV